MSQAKIYSGQGADMIGSVVGSVSGEAEWTVHWLSDQTVKIST